jgi:hypothetical protein
LSGVTLGLIPVVLGENDQGQIDRILAPDVIHSQYFGWGARWRIFRNPSDDEKMHVVVGAKQSVEREFDAAYDLGLQRESDWTWNAHAMLDRSGTGRFFGLGNDSTLAGQASFIDSQARLEGTAARNFTHAWQLAYRLRADSVDIEQQTWDPSVPSIESVYPELPGIGRASEVQQELSLAFDTRDSVTVTRSGERFVEFAGMAARALGGSAAYSYLGFDATHFQPFGADLTLVAHTALRVMPQAGEAPFWALSSLGGDRSVIGEAQPLRAFPAGRFVDRDVVAASLEARTWVTRFSALQTELRFELAPFVDAGKVFSSFSAGPLSEPHAAAGLGFRLVAAPFVVGYLDIGMGSEGLAVFSGIDYPF